MTKDTSDLLLLDVNVLLAVAWPNHQFHRAALQRLARSQNRWATCALTQLGFIRLSSNPAAVPFARRPSEAAALLRTMVEDARHVYLEALPSPIAREFTAALERSYGHQQVTDSYLLALSRWHEATFVTFDARLKHITMPGTKLEVLGLSH